MLFITHDLALVAGIARFARESPDLAGKLVERALLPPLPGIKEDQHRSQHRAGH